MSDWAQAEKAAARIAARCPGWQVKPLRHPEGLRLEAVRTGDGEGVCAMIGTPAEVRAELTRAR